MCWLRRRELPSAKPDEQTQRLFGSQAWQQLRQASGFAGDSCGFFMFFSAATIFLKKKLHIFQLVHHEKTFSFELVVLRGVQTQLEQPELFQTTML